MNGIDSPARRGARPLPHPLPGNLRVWWIELDAWASAMRAEEVPEPERALAKRMSRSEDEVRFLAGRDALRRLLAATLDLPPHTLRIEPDAYGKLRLVDGALRFSLSRSGPFGLVGLCRDREVGVDVEVLRSVPERETLAREQFAAAEREAWHGVAPAERDLAFLRCWTRKEAVAKALGTGLRLPPARIDAGCDPGIRTVSIGPEGRTCGSTVCSLDLPPGTAAVAAVAVTTPESAERAREELAAP